MLQYLLKGMAGPPNLTFATDHQRHSHDRVAKGHKKEAFSSRIFDPDKSKEVNSYCSVWFFVDADFAGMWGREDDQDRRCVKSWTGFIRHLHSRRCLVGWKSKLKTEDIAMSTGWKDLYLLAQEASRIHQWWSLQQPSTTSYPYVDGPVKYLSCVM